ncbi:MAG TPA: hypothetical protein VGG03_11625 [Thermoanaerobaculia bacterium]|jgi:hypothetical protein
MKRSDLPIVFLLAVLIAVAGCTSTGGDRSSSASQASGPASDVAAMISGTYRLQDQGSDLRLTISGTGGTGQRLDLFTSARGSYGGRNVTEQGVLHVASEGPDALVTYTPHFDPSVTVLSPNLNNFSQAEIQAACSLYLRPDESGWRGDTQEKGQCVRAIGGAVGRWTVEIRPGEIRFTNPGNQQTLVFRKG